MDGSDKCVCLVEPKGGRAENDMAALYAFCSDGTRQYRTGAVQDQNKSDA